MLLRCGRRMRRRSRASGRNADGASSLFRNFQEIGMTEPENPAAETPEPSSPTARTKAIRAIRTLKSAQDEVVSQAVDRRNPDRLARAFARARAAANEGDSGYS